MSHRLRAAATLAAAGALGACGNDRLTDVNRNPNSPTDAPTGALFTQDSRNVVTTWFNGVGVPRYEVLAQHVAEVQYPDHDTYRRLRASQTSGLFNGPYSTELADLQLIVARGVSAKAAGTYAPAMVLRSFSFGYLTDVFGDIPYSQAFKADSGVLAPKYDGQAAVYAGILSELARASADLSGAQNTLGSADRIYGGDPARWQKLANSLRARHALRLVNVDPSTADAQLKAAFAAPGGLITSNADNAAYRWPGDGVYDNPWAVNFKTRDDVRVSDRLVSILKGLNDPRIHTYALRVEQDAAEVPARSTVWCPDGTRPCYAGLANALTQAQASAFLPTTSRPGAALFPGATAYGTVGGGGGSDPSWLFTAAEALLIRAEAAARGLGGLTPAQAAGFYQSALRASLEQWGVPAAQVTAYLASPAGTLRPGAEGLKQIAVQKWLALYTNGLQAWIEFRRTCQPAIVRPGPSATEAAIPRRLMYSTNEYATNADELAAAVARQGADNLQTRMYWDGKSTAAPTYEAGCGVR